MEIIRLSKLFSTTGKFAISESGMAESHRLFKGFGKIIVVNVFLFGDVLQPVERRKLV